MWMMGKSATFVPEGVFGLILMIAYHRVVDMEINPLEGRGVW